MRTLIFLLTARILSAQASGSVSGAVSDAATRLPLAHAQVSAGRTFATTDAAGAYLLKDVPAGETEVRVRLQGYRDREADVTVAPGGLLRQDFELTKLARVTGRIVDRDTGEAVKQFSTVMLRPGVLQPGVPPLHPGFVKPSGEFAIENVEPGDYVLEMPASGGVHVEWDVTRPAKTTKAYGAMQYPLPISLTEGEERLVEIALNRTPVYSATCAFEFPAGYPEEAAITIRRLSGNSGATETYGHKSAGPFRLEGLQRGTHTISVMAGSKESRAYGDATVTITDHDVDGVRIRLVRGVNVTGTLRMLEDKTEPPDRGDPAAPVAWLVSADTPHNREQLKGEPSRFHGEGIAPGAYRLELQRLPDGYAITDVLAGGAGTAGGRFTLNGPSELTVLLTSKPGMIAGVIRDKNQAPLKGERVRLISLRADDPALNRTAESGPGGAFVFRNLPPGKYRLEGGAEIEVRTGETSVSDVTR